MVKTRHYRSKNRSSGLVGLSEFLKAAGVLKTTLRTGWVKKVGIKDAESVADHSFRMALIGIALGEELSLDSSKIARMCLIHDIAEAKTGDMMPEQKESERDHRRKENTVVRSILSKLPIRARKRLLLDWNELFQAKTDEARLVWQIDKLEMALQAKDYLRKGYTKDKLSQFEQRRYLSQELRHVLDEYKP